MKRVDKKEKIPFMGQLLSASADTTWNNLARRDSLHLHQSSLDSTHPGGPYQEQSLQKDVSVSHNLCMIITRWPPGNGANLSAQGTWPFFQIKEILCGTAAEKFPYQHESRLPVSSPITILKSQMLWRMQARQKYWLFLAMWEHHILEMIRHHV